MFTSISYIIYIALLLLIIVYCFLIIYFLMYIYIYIYICTFIYIYVYVCHPIPLIFVTPSRPARGSAQTPCGRAGDPSLLIGTGKGQQMSAACLISHLNRWKNHGKPIFIDEKNHLNRWDQPFIDVTN